MASCPSPASHTSGLTTPAQAENPIRYEKEHWNLLLRMMDRHEIVYRLQEQDWLVGQLVSLTKPATCRGMGAAAWQRRAAHH